mmetsp:Transcript_26637/g.48006  ORF Transcript_26637/g.48006 Transcript_26637/m.48006 type:complete len:98 (+) Transcript_26637:508-801(+)
MAPTDVSRREITGLELIMSAASPKLTLPQTPQELEGAKTRTDSKPQELAAEFVLYDDPMELPARDPRFMERYALVVRVLLSEWRMHRGLNHRLELVG